MTKVKKIEIRRTRSGRQCLIFYGKSEGTEYDEVITLDQEGCPAKIPVDIVESLELVESIDTDLTMEFEDANLTDKAPIVHYDCNHDCDALYESYHKGFLEGRDMKKVESSLSRAKSGKA